jgi:hypothetical protein
MSSLGSKPNGRVLFLTISEDGGVLLDLRCDQWLKLNKVGVEMWTALSQGTRQATVIENIAHKYQVDPLRVAEDLKNLVAGAAALGLTPDCSLLTEQGQSEDPSTTLPSFRWYGQDPSELRPRAKLRTVLVAFAALAVFDFMLSFISLEFLCDYVKSRGVKRRVATDLVTVVGQTCIAVEKACVWYPKKALCLQRSAVTACMLRSQGVRARMVIGVRSMPFLAHAWVEAEGSVLNDFPRVRKFYQSVSAY